MCSIIKTSIHLVSREETNLSKMFPINKLTKSTMVLISPNCYHTILNNSTTTPVNPNCPHANNFIHQTEDGTLSISLIHLYSANWVFLEYLHYNSFEHTNFGYIPTNIIFVAYEEEFIHKDISAEILRANDYESPADCIMQDLPEFKNSLFFLTEEAYLKLKGNTSTISNYCGMERLIWNPDDSYPGGNIMLHSLNGNYLHYVEGMSFPFIERDFSSEGLPNSVYFVIVN